MKTEIGTEDAPKSLADRLFEHRLVGYIGYADYISECLKRAQSLAGMIAVAADWEVFSNFDMPPLYIAKTADAAVREIEEALIILEDFMKSMKRDP
jgi:hypothetical protein